MATPLPLDKPTRKGIESLFRDMLHEDRNDDQLAILSDEAHAKVEALEKKLKATPKYRKLRAAHSRAHSVYWAARQKRRAEVIRLRNLFWAKGLTADVRKGIEALLKRRKK